MPKPITSEMLHAMSAAEQKTLHQNATRLGTPAAQAVLEMMAENGWASPSEPAASKAKPAKATKRKSPTAPVRKTTRASHGRQS